MEKDHANFSYQQLARLGQEDTYAQWEDKPDAPSHAHFLADSLKKLEEPKQAFKWNWKPHIYLQIGWEYPLWFTTGIAHNVVESNLPFLCVGIVNVAKL